MRQASKFLPAPIFFMLAACSNPLSSDQFVQRATAVASFPGCRTVRLIMSFEGSTQTWQSGEEYTVKLSPDCYRNWMAQLNERHDFRRLAGGVEDVDPAVGGVYDNGLDRKLGRVTVAFVGDGTVKFAWRNMK